MSNCWLVVADRAQARVFKQRADGGLDLVTRFDNPAARAFAHELTATSPGRRGDSFGHRHALGPADDAKKQATAEFARTVRDYLEVGRRAGHFDELALVAAPGFLGVLRKSLTAACRKKLTRVLRKDLMHCSEYELQRRLAAEAAPA